jgi:hypothetical protein
MTPTRAQTGSIAHTFATLPTRFLSPHRGRLQPLDDFDKTARVAATRMMA